MRGQMVGVVRDGRSYTVTVTASPKAFEQAKADLSSVLDSWEWES